MAKFYSQYTTDGAKPIPVAKGSEILSLRGEIAVTTALASADLLLAAVLPEDHVPVDFHVDSDDLDTHATPTITLSAGLLTSALDDLSSASADGGAVWMVDSTVAQAGGLVRPTTKTVTRVSPSATTRRTVGLKVTNAGATKAAGTVGFTLHYRAAYGGK